MIYIYIKNIDLCKIGILHRIKMISFINSGENIKLTQVQVQIENETIIICI